MCNYIQNLEPLQIQVPIPSIFDPHDFVRSEQLPTWQHLDIPNPPECCQSESSCWLEEHLDLPDPPEFCPSKCDGWLEEHLDLPELHLPLRYAMPLVAGVAACLRGDIYIYTQ